MEHRLEGVVHGELWWELSLLLVSKRPGSHWASPPLSLFGLFLSRSHQEDANQITAGHRPHLRELGLGGGRPPHPRTLPVSAAPQVQFHQSKQTAKIATSVGRRKPSALLLGNKNGAAGLGKTVQKFLKNNFHLIHA